MLILLGGGNYEAITVTHKIASAPPRSLSMIQGPYGFFPVLFWIIFHPLTDALVMLALIFNWKLSLFRRRILLVSFAITILIRLATFLYFAPETGVITGVNSTDTIDLEMVERAQRWEALNLIRLAAYYTIGVLLLFAVNRNITRLEAST
jgi:hypothetical protein